jgi:hydroxymethylbilane synthase
LGTVNGTDLKLKGMVADVDGERILYDSAEGDALSPEEVGVRLAQKMLAMGASEFITEAKLG